MGTIPLPESVKKILPQVDDSKLDSESLFDIESEVIDVAARWEHFGSALRIPPEKLSTIKATPGNSTPESCLKSTLTEFLKKNYKTEKYGEPSWRLIVAAVASKAGGDNVDLALKIAEDHSTTPAAVSPTSVSSGASSSGNKDKSILDERPDLPHIQYIKYRSESAEKICRAIDDIATELEAVALQLGVKKAKIKIIIKAKPDPIEGASEVLSFWLNSDTEATWARLIAAMKTKEDLIVAAKELETALLNMIPN